MESEPKRLDDCITMGRYVIMVCIMAELMILPQVSSIFYMIYAGASPSLSACGAEHIFDSDLEEREVCQLYHQVTPGNCSAPSLRYEFKSVNVEWNYFCERANTIKNSISVQMIGVLTGSMVFGQLSDQFGRRKGLLGTMTGMALCWLFVAKASTLIQFTATRTVVGFFTGGSISVLNVFIMENIPKRHRMWINMVITWSPNMIPTSVMAWLTAEWRKLALLNFVICVPGIVFCLIRIHESPRWLMQRGRIIEASDIMKREFNSVKEVNIDDVMEAEFQLVTQSGSQKRRYSVAHLFCSAKIATTTVVLAFSYFSTSIVNYGIIFNMEKISGSIYLNSIYTGLMRYACNLTFGYADLKCKRIGRKFVHTSGLVVIILSLVFVITAHSLDLSHTLREEIRIFVLLASSMTSQNWHISTPITVAMTALLPLEREISWKRPNYTIAKIYITAGIVGNELFPTPIRNIGYSFLQLCNRLGVIISPLVFYSITLSTVLPYCIMVIFCLINMFTFECLLPETKGRDLVNQMPPPKQRDRRYRPKRKELLGPQPLLQQERQLLGTRT